MKDMRPLLDLYAILFNIPITIVGDDNANVLTGDAGNNGIDGRGGDDVISGGDGDDRLTGGAGPDASGIADWMMME